MSKRSLLSQLLFLILFLVLQPHHTFADKSRIYDEAHLLKDEEINFLERKAKKLSDKRETDFMIVTITEDLAEDIEQYVQDLYDKKSLGDEGENGSVAILGVDIDRRDVVLLGFQEAKERLDAERLDKIRQKITPKLTEEDYLSAFDRFLKISSDYMRFKPGINPDNLFYKTWVQLLLAMMLASGIVGIMLSHRKAKITITEETYLDSARTKINRKRDRFIRKSVTRRLKPQNNSNQSNRQRTSSFSSRTSRTSGGRSSSRSRGKF